MEVEHQGIGKREKLSDAPEKMALRIQHDLWYIQNWSLGLDLKILVMTPKTMTYVLVQRSAY